MVHADSSRALQPYVFARLEARVAALQAAGRDVIDLGQADPDGAAPAPVVAALQAAAADPEMHHYPPFRGTARFREAVAAWYARRFDVRLDPEREVLALQGAKQGLFHLALACLTAADAALVPDPAFPTYADGTRFAGAQVWRLPLHARHGYYPVLDAVPPEVLWRSRLLYLNYPHNPTGAIPSRAFLSYAVDFCRQHEILLCYDNAYSEITYEGYTAPSILELPGARETAIEIITFSKAYNMAGFRLAMAAGNADAIATLATLESKANTGVFAAVQAAGVAALERVYGTEFASDLRKKYQRRRDMARFRLQAMGLAVPEPMGAAYLWVPVPSGFGNCEAFADHLLETAAVCIAPGTAFGQEGAGHFRISLTCPDDRLEQGLDRMAATLAEHSRA